MIAFGLSLMGGCFAQDDTTAAVDTYWPAHSVQISGKGMISPVNATNGPEGPFWEPSMRCGCRIENLEWDINYRRSLALVYFGDWVDPVRQFLPICAYVSFGGQSSIGPGYYALYETDGSFGLFLGATPSETGIVPWTQVEADFYKVQLSSSIGTQVQNFPDDRIVSDRSFRWAIRVKGDNTQSCEICSCWWISESDNRYFFMQPMSSFSGLYAFFTHGYNILTEL